MMLVDIPASMVCRFFVEAYPFHSSNLPCVACTGLLKTRALFNSHVLKATDSPDNSKNVLKLCSGIQALLPAKSGRYGWSVAYLSECIMGNRILSKKLEIIGSSYYHHAHLYSSVPNIQAELACRTSHAHGHDYI